MGINVKLIERLMFVGFIMVVVLSQSVYQSMYCSFFDWKNVSGLVENGGVSMRFKKVGNVFYIVLRYVQIFYS